MFGRKVNVIAALDGIGTVALCACLQQDIVDTHMLNGPQPIPSDFVCGAKIKNENSLGCVFSGAALSYGTRQPCVNGKRKKQVVH